MTVNNNTHWVWGLWLYLFSGSDSF